MIQRIQSVYLLLAAILMAVTVFSPLAILKDQSGNLLDFFATGIHNGSEVALLTWGVLTMATLAAFVALIAILIFKNRKRQIKLTYVLCILIVLFYVTTAVYLYSAQGSLRAELLSVKYGLALPLLALIFTFLAVTKIKADDKLVRSLDRIR